MHINIVEFKNDLRKMYARSLIDKYFKIEWPFIDLKKSKNYYKTW